MPASWAKLGLGAVALFSNTVLAYAKLGGRLPVSPGYQPKNPCPGRCSTAGSNPGNWSLYHNLDQIGSCDQTMFYDFSLLDPVDDPSALHRIYSCSSYGPDWSNLPNATGNAALGTPINSTYQFGTGSEGGMSPSYVRSLSRQIREYLANGFGATNNSVILFARAGKTSAGLYIGKGLQNEGTGYFALTSFENAVASAAQGTGTVAMQLCQPGNDGDHVFGIMATSNSTFEPIQEALQSWSNAECLSFSNTTNITGPAYITTPLVLRPQIRLSRPTPRQALPLSDHRPDVSSVAILAPTFKLPRAMVATLCRKSAALPKTNFPSIILRTPTFAAIFSLASMSAAQRERFPTLPHSQTLMDPVPHTLFRAATTVPPLLQQIA
jgi:hypothetical protein